MPSRRQVSVGARMHPKILYSSLQVCLARICGYLTKYQSERRFIVNRIDLDRSIVRHHDCFGY